MGLRERFQQPGPKRILSLDGGGARGLLSLGILAQLERHLGERSGDPANFRLAHYFDLIGGTSTGAIIATTLALEWKVREVVDLYFKLLPAIFARPQVPSFLRVFVPARRLAHIDALGIAARASQDHLRHQPVVQDHVGLLQQLLRAQRQKVRIARTHADEINLPAHITRRSARLVQRALRGFIGPAGMA